MPHSRRLRRPLCSLLAFASFRSAVRAAKRASERTIDLHRARPSQSIKRRLGQLSGADEWPRAGCVSLSLELVVVVFGQRLIYMQATLAVPACGACASSHWPAACLRGRARPRASLCPVARAPWPARTFTAAASGRPAGKSVALNYGPGRPTSFCGFFTRTDKQKGSASRPAGLHQSGTRAPRRGQLRLQLILRLLTWTASLHAAFERAGRAGRRAGR